MKKKNMDLAFAYIMLIIVFVFVLVTSTIYHELAHKEILKHSGVQNVTIKMTWFGMQTAGEGKCDDVCELSNNINEVVGYNMEGLYLLAFGTLLIYITLKMEMKK